MQTRVFEIKQAANGEWQVCESGRLRPLRKFDSRDDAVEYANGIARTKSAAEVRVLGGDGRVESVIAFMPPADW